MEAPRFCRDARVKSGGGFFVAKARQIRVLVRAFAVVFSL
jgi:hypothetical protein